MPKRTQSGLNSKNKMKNETPVVKAYSSIVDTEFNLNVSRNS